MVAEPFATPVTTPVVLTDAIAALLVVQVPYAEALENVVVVPVQIFDAPLMEAGVVLTSNDFKAEQPVLV